MTSRSLSSTPCRPETAHSIRSRVEAAHTGPFLGVAATGRRFSYESLDFVKLTAGRIGWCWLLMDLWGARQQLTAPAAAYELQDRTS